MCQGKPTGTPQNLHEKICHTTHGIPCRAAHAIGSLFNLILGRQRSAKDCCSGHSSSEAGSTCGCQTEKH
jgi:hypothetical protein